MKRPFIACLIYVFTMSLPAGTAASDYLAEADRLYELGGLENYKQSIELCLKALEARPDDFEAAWRCARAYRFYGDRAKKQALENWKDICARYGKTGMRYALKACEQEPDKPQGHYYYGLCVGVYSDGVSILTALKQGLKKKTQNSFEKAYALDRTFDDAGPVLSLGRFWAVLPWPLRDRKQALDYYRQYQATAFFTGNIEAYLFLAELLIQLGGRENKTEAAGYVDKALLSGEPYFKDWARKLQKKLR